MKKEKIDIRDIYGEYDPPLPFNENPTEEQKEAARKLMEELEHRAAERKRKEKRKNKTIKRHPKSGCFFIDLNKSLKGSAFPAHAGVIPPSNVATACTTCFLRTRRGDHKD